MERNKYLLRHLTNWEQVYYAQRNYALPESLVKWLEKLEKTALTNNSVQNSGSRIP